MALFLGDQAKGMNLEVFQREGFKGASYLTYMLADLLK